MPKMIDISGQTFGRLTVLSLSGKTRNNASIWLCKCACGKTKNIIGNSLKRGASKTCGCGIGSSSRVCKFIHGGGGTKLYGRWKAMIQRCRPSHHACRKNYTILGIKVCERWRDFENFRSDMGPGFQEDLDLDRINNEGNYEPGNCRWVLPKINARNRSTNHWLEINGVRKSMAEWAEISNIPYEALRYRVRRGDREEDLLLPCIGRKTRKTKKKSKQSH